MANLEYTEFGSVTLDQPINALAFSPSGTLLASGGDDQRVRTWSLQNEQISKRQIIKTDGPPWGQITSLQFSETIPMLSGPTKRTLLFVGTGRGYVAFSWMIDEKTFAVDEMVTKLVFPVDEAVSHLKYDALNQCLVVASIKGSLRTYAVDFDLFELDPIFQLCLDDILRDVHFIGRSAENLLVHGLTSGNVWCINPWPWTNSMKWTKTFAGAIGHAALSQDQKLHLVQNISSGYYDLYRFGEDIPFKTFSVLSSQMITTPCLFHEGDHVVVLANDEGCVSICDVRSGAVIQSLMLGTTDTAIQALAVWQSDTRFLIAAGSTDPSIISVWEKAPRKRAAQPEKTQASGRSSNSHTTQRTTRQTSHGQTNFLVVSNIFALVLLFIWIGSQINVSPFLTNIGELGRVLLTKVEDYIRDADNHF